MKTPGAKAMAVSLGAELVYGTWLDAWSWVVTDTMAESGVCVAIGANWATCIDVIAGTGMFACICAAIGAKVVTSIGVAALLVGAKVVTCSGVDGGTVRMAGIGTVVGAKISTYIGDPAELVGNGTGDTDGA